jgi:8-oxo-dGTP pyrophosphatase MutT (NUDIX family)
VTDPSGPDPIRRIRAREVYANDYLRLYDDDVSIRGAEGRYVRVEPAGGDPGAVVLPVGEGRVGLVEVFRYALGAWQWGLPRGFAHGADPLVTARAELAEETGVREARLRLLGHVTPDSGLQSHRVAVVLAEVSGPLPEGPPPDDEVRAVRWPTVGELDAEIAGGRIEDGFTLAALALARAVGALPAS